jgi:hypothetical protein
MATNNKTSTLKAVKELMQEVLRQLTPGKLRKGYVASERNSGTNYF